MPVDNPALESSHNSRIIEGLPYLPPFRLQVGQAHYGSARTMTITGSEVRTVPSASVPSTEKTW